MVPMQKRFAMARLFLFDLALLCWGFAPTEALAIGSDHPKELVGASNLWPEGLKDLVNQPDRVHGC